MFINTSIEIPYITQEYRLTKHKYVGCSVPTCVSTQVQTNARCLSKKKAISNLSLLLPSLHGKHILIGKKVDTDDPGIRINLSYEG